MSSPIALHLLRGVPEQLDRATRQPRACSVQMAADGRPGRCVIRLWLDGGAYLHGEGAASSEPAALHVACHLADLSLEDDPLPLVLSSRVWYRDGGQECRRVRMRRPLVDLVGVALFDDLAEVHHSDPVADVSDDREIVGDEQVGNAQLVLQLGQQVDHLRLSGDVERTDRLVADQ